MAWTDRCIRRWTPIKVMNSYKARSPRRTGYSAVDECDFGHRAASVPTSNGVGDGVCSWLWGQCTDIAQKALEIEYIQGIHHGNLNPNFYGSYGIQDAIYCFNATRNLDFVGKKKECDQGDADMKKFVEERKANYEEYTEALFKQWHITNPSGIQMGPAAQSYSNVETRVAKDMDPIYFLIAMVPCDMLWHWLADSIKDGQGDSNVYSFWITENGGQSSMELEKFIDARKDRINLPEARKVFRECMEGELRFFKSATT